MRSWLTVLLGLLAVLPAEGGEDPRPAAPAQVAPTIAEAAEHVRMAWGAQDGPALKALASAQVPDPWEVADQLLMDGHREAALAFAVAAPRPDTQGLLPYVRDWRGGVEDGARRALLGLLQADLAAGRHAEARTRLEAAEPRLWAGAPPDVLHLLLERARGQALAGTEERGQAWERQRGVAAAAETMGWLTEAVRLLSPQWLERNAAGDRGGALEDAEHLVRLHERRGDEPALARALNWVGISCNESGQQARATEAYVRALAIQVRLGDPLGAGWTRMRLGNVQMAEGRPDEAVRMYERSLDEMRASRDGAGVLAVLGNLKWAFEVQGRLGAVLPRLLAAADEFHAGGFEALEGQALSLAGTVQNETGQQEAALALYARALAIQERTGDTHALPVTHLRMGNAHTSAGRYATAHEHLLLAARGLSSGDSEHLRAQVLANLGDLCRLMGHYEEALVHLGRASEIARASDAVLVLAHIDLNLGAIHNERGDQRRALQHYGAAQAALSGLKRPIDLATARQRAAQAHMELGAWDAARSELEAALSTFAGGVRPDHEVHVLLSLARLAMLQGQPGQALELIERAQAQAKALGSEALQAFTQADLARYHNERGDQAASIRCYREAIAAFRHGQAHADAARAQLNLGNAQRASGDLDGAMATWTEALAWYEAAGLDGSKALALSNLGDLHRERGAYGRALLLLERAQSIYERLEHPLGRAHVLTNRGAIFNEIDDQERSSACYSSALACLEPLGARREIAGVLSRLANVHLARGEPVAADAALVRAAEQFDLAQDEAGRTWVQVTRGWVLATRGEHDRALALFDGVLAHATSKGDTLAALEAEMGRAAALERLGRLGESLQAWDHAQEGALEERSTTKQTRVLRGRADAALAMGRTGEAQRDARAAIERAVQLAEGLAQQEAPGARESLGRAYEIGMVASRARSDDVGLGWFLEMSRAGGLRDALGSAVGLEQAVLPADLRADLLRARADERRAMGAWREVSRAGDTSAARAAQGAYQQAQGRTAEIVARIERESRGAATVSLGSVDGIETIQGGLALDEALVLYGLPREEAFALVVSRERRRVVGLGAPGEIEQAAQDLLDAIARRLPREQVESLAEALAAKVVVPLDLAPTTRRLLISPTGSLGFVPFGLLDGSRELVLSPSGTVHGLLSARNAQSGTGILALGDPDYSLASATTLERGQRAGARLKLGRLDASRAEAEAVGTTTLLGREASETGLVRALATNPRWRAVHLACHGLVDPERAIFSALALTPDGDEDGFLTALEIFRLKVPADLVVLSACDTGKGKVYRTEGIVGLTRAFMHAGAPRVMCSLWRVDDQATSALMTRFYELWDPKDGGAGIPAAAALRAAQAFVRHHPAHPEWQHPYYWAAWVLWGLP